MDPDQMQTIAARDQLWASLRVLRPEIDKLASGPFEGTEREWEIIRILARIVSAELDFRANEAR